MRPKYVSSCIILIQKLGLVQDLEIVLPTVNELRTCLDSIFLKFIFNNTLSHKIILSVNLKFFLIFKHTF